MILDMCWKMSKKPILKMRFSPIVVLALMLGALISCQPESPENEATEEKPVFELLEAKNTGIDFTNTLEYDNEFNVYRYRNYYNGGGVAIGDINNDSLPDIYFIANQKKNTLYSVSYTHLRAHETDSY